ncbi:adhesion G-protein coupled receptor G2-like isoform X2 [Apostichopus japonicus]
MKLYQVMVLTLALTMPLQSVGQEIGCFYSNTSNLWLRKKLFPGSLSISTCRDFCPSNSIWFGLEDGFKCYCANPSTISIYDTAQAAPPSDCDTSCYDAINCGGQNVAALYKGNTYQGCYENTNEVSIPFNQPKADLDVAKCLETCQNFQLFLLTQGDKCICTNQRPDSVKRRVDSECIVNGIKCTGGEKCGGFERVSIWKFENSMVEFETIENEVKTATDSLKQENVTDNKVFEAAKVIETATSNVKYVEEDTGRLEDIADFMETLAHLGEPSVNITRPIVNTVNNLMKLDEEIVQMSSAETGRVLDALEQQISNLQTKDGNYTQITDKIGIKALKVNPRHIKTSLSFGTVAQSSKKSNNNSALGDTRMLDEQDDLAAAKTVISIPAEYLQLYSNGSSNNNSNVPISFIIYDNPILFVPASEPLKSVNDTNTSEFSSREIVGSQVIAVKIEGNQTTQSINPTNSNVTAMFVTDPITLQSGERIESEDCVRWDNVEKEWSKAVVTYKKQRRTRCSCNRLGSFAVLIRIGKSDPLPSHESLYWITLIGSAVSCICLMLSIVTFLSLKTLRMKKPIYIHLNLCISLLAFYVAFLLSTKAVPKSTECSVVSAIVHYFGLVLVLWMSIEAIYLYIMFVKRDKSNIQQFLVVSCCVGYGVPVIPAVLVAVFDKSQTVQEIH